MKKGRTVGSRNGVYTIRRSREEAETLFLENMKLVPFVIKKMEIDYTEDAMQEGYVGLWRAALCFDDSMGKKFSPYAFQAIRGQIIREYQGRKKSIQPEISLDYLFCSEGAYNGEEGQLHEAIEDADASRIFPEIELGVYLEQKLSELELRLTKLKLAGFSSREISEYFGKSRMWADNKVKEIRVKLQEITQ